MKHSVGKSALHLDARLAGYLAGLEAGYYARVREENGAYPPESRILAGAAFYDRSTGAERRAERMATIREAHDAGVHGDGVYGCPWCPTRGDVILDARSQVR